MKASELIALFERMLAEHWAYEYGAAREGCVDCSGAFVWAYKQHGQSIAHGSNTIARRHVRGGLRPISEAKPGWAVFKRRFDGLEPDQYANDGLGNLYHIGLLAADGVNVLNAKSEESGFSSDPIGKWQLAAPLKGVEYEEDEKMEALYRATVATERDPLRVRSAPETGAIIGHVPRGEIVDVLAAGDWPRIRYGEMVGYASGAYLRRIGGDAATDAEAGQAVRPSGEGNGTVGIPRVLAQQLYRVLGEALSVD